MGKVRLAATAVLLCLVFADAFAQTSNATLGGTVADSSGALIPGVTITATNTGTGIVTTVFSNESGAYQFASLQPGTYRVSSELPGFQTQTYSDVALGGSQQVRLNFTLQVGSVTQAVEVTVAADTLLATSSSSVGTVLPEYKVRDLPLAGRNVLGLVMTTAGTQSSGVTVGNFAGGRLSMVNTTRDGMNVSDGRYENGAFSVTYTSPDLVEEVRVIVAPADAETSRGSGQVQMTTRSGTNQFRGSVFWTDRNSALDSNAWFNNFNGVEKNYLNRNQFGGRLGGPIIKNKTFFFFLYEGQRIVQRDSVVASVLTGPARQGIFRYFPNVQNGNVFSSNPTVDVNGDPVTPRGATGSLQSFNVFTRDPLRTGFDPRGYIPSMLTGMPMPNDFTIGDGLNTAGIRWTRRTSGTDFANGNGNDVNRNQYNLRVDHNINTSHKLSVAGTKERTWATIGVRDWPQGYDGLTIRLPEIYTVSFVSTLSPSLVNEFRAGRRQSTQWWWNAPTLYAPNGDLREAPRTMGPGITEQAKEAFALVPQSNGIPFTPITTLFPGGALGVRGNSRGTLSPLSQYADTLSWTRGTHAFKGGFEFRTSATTGGHDQDAWPRVNLGAGGVPVTGIDNTGLPGLSGTDQTTARNLLTDLNGSIGTITQAFYITDSLKEFKPYPEESVRYRDYRANEWSVFFKDDWKLRPNLTMNLGARYDFYGVPWEGRGVLGRPAGGEAGLFGISGTSFADLWQPGRLNGSLTAIEFVGKKGPNPETLLQPNDWNNIAPALGFSWSLPWLGKDKTVLRAGYGIAYSAGNNRLFYFTSGNQGSIPGLNVVPNLVYSTYTNLATVRLPISGPGIPGVPLEAVPLTQRNQNLRGFSDNRVTEYVQNFSIELQREVVRNLTVEVRYVGSKGSKLFGGVPINNVNIFENGILDAYNITRAGGNAPLFDQMLNGLNLGLGAVNGTTVTGSASLRQNTLFRAFIANGDVGQFANLLNTTTTVTGEGGGLLRNGRFPENFIVANPQFVNVTVDGNPGNSTYHSMNLSLTKRLSQGFTNQTTYTWSRTLGENDGDDALEYLNPRNRALNKTLLGYHRTHDFRSNGTFELPFGPGRPLLNNAPGWISRLVERWQLGGIFSWSSGQPLTINASTSSFTQGTGGPPNIVGDFPKSIGQVTKLPTGVTYFDGLSQIVDPGVADVTTLQGTNGSFSNRAIVDSQGRLLLVNPAPGTIGNLGLQWISGPAAVSFDANLVKRVIIQENKEFEFRIDAINMLNHPNFANPTLDINSTNFGRISSASGNRSFVISGRLNF